MSPLSAPVERKHLHTRRYEFQGYQRTDGCGTRGADRYQDRGSQRVARRDLAASLRMTCGSGSPSTTSSW
jgi:hypothetical protein